jgi:hypothetical protein
MINLAYLKQDCPWFRLFPTGVPIRNIVVPNVVECQGDGVQEVYMVDLDKLPAELFDELARLVHQQCDPSVPFAIMKKEIRALGLPLRAKHVQSITTDVPFFL